MTYKAREKLEDRNKPGENREMELPEKKLKRFIINILK